MFDNLSVMMVVSFSSGVKVMFEAMKSLVQLEIYRHVSIREFYRELAYDKGHVSLSLKIQYHDHFDQAFKCIVLARMDICSRWYIRYYCFYTKLNYLL